MLKPLLTLCAIWLAAAAHGATTPARGAERAAAVTPLPAAVVANGKTAEKKARPKASKKPRKASRAEAPASGSASGGK